MAAPGKVQSLGRLVGLSDYEAEARAIAGVDGALARWEMDDGLPAVVITVLMERGRESEFEAVREILVGVDRERGADRFPLRVVEGQWQYLHLKIEYVQDERDRQEDVELEIREVLGLSGYEEEGVSGDEGLFSPLRRRFGEKEYATRIEGRVQNVEGVSWCRVVAFGTNLSDPEGESDAGVLPDSSDPQRGCGSHESPPHARALLRARRRLAPPASAPHE